MVFRPCFLLPGTMTCSQQMAVSWSLLIMTLFSSREATGLQKAISMPGMPGPVWHSTEWLNAQTSVALSCSKPPHVPADTAHSHPQGGTAHGTQCFNSRMEVEWHCFPLCRRSIWLRAQFSAGAHSWACSCMQLLTDLERATVTGYGEKKTDVNKRNSWYWSGSSRKKKIIKKNKKRKMLWL